MEIREAEDIPIIHTVQGAHDRDRGGIIRQRIREGFLRGRMEGDVFIEHHSKLLGKIL